MSEEKAPLPPAEGIGPPLRPSGVKMPDDPIIVGRKTMDQKQPFWYAEREERRRKREERKSERPKPLAVLKPVEPEPEPKWASEWRDKVLEDASAAREKVDIDNRNYYGQRYSDDQESWVEDNKDLVWWGAIISVGVVIYIIAVNWQAIADAFTSGAL